MIVALAISAVISGCISTSQPTSGPPSTSGPGPGLSAAPSAICEPVGSPPPRPAGLASAGIVWTIANDLAEPDDLLFANDSLFIGLMGSGSIEQLGPAGVVTLPVHVAGIEGMAFIGSRLYLAGQVQDAVFEWLGGSQLRKVIQLQPVSGQPGVDGISAQGGLLIVPDSPRGVVDWVDPASGAIVRHVAGFERPTGAWPAHDGSLLVADEYGSAAFRIAPDGSRSAVARLPLVDDVAEDSQGGVFVVTAGSPDGRLAQVAGGSTVGLVDQLRAGQGLAVDGADNLYVSESGSGRVDLLVRTFKLVPIRRMGSTASSMTQPPCVDLQRAAGFRAPIRLVGGPGVEVVTQPGTGSRGAVRATGCSAAAPCQVTAVSGSLRDVLQLGP